MSTAATNGAPISHDRGDEIPVVLYNTDPYFNVPSPSTMLQYLLVDGATSSHAGLASYIAYSVKDKPAPIEVCPANHFLIAGHWRFGNERNLGWLAILLTLLAGILDIYYAFKLSKRHRVDGINVLRVIDAFHLGSGLEGTLPQQGTRFCFRDGRLVRPGLENFARRPTLEKDGFP
jgi:hypothetical protein